MFLTVASRTGLLSALLVALTMAQEVTVLVPGVTDPATAPPPVEFTTTPPLDVPTTTTPFDVPVGAESTTTATTSQPLPPPPPYSCYECDSGSSAPGMWHNENCREDGIISEWVYISTCPTFCYSYVGRYPPGTVFRGCAKNLYLGETQPGEGCYEDPANKRYVCLCAGDLCNKQDLVQQSQNYTNQALSKLP